MTRWLRTLWVCDRMLFWQMLVACVLLPSVAVACGSVALYYAITEPTHCRCR